MSSFFPSKQEYLDILVSAGFQLRAQLLFLLGHNTEQGERIFIDLRVGLVVDACVVEEKKEILLHLVDALILQGNL